MTTFDRITTQDACDWIDLLLVSPYIPYPDAVLRSPEVRRRQDGDVELRGWVLRSSGTLTNADQVAQLPAGMWPAKNDGYAVIAFNNQVAIRLDITSDGGVYIFGPPAGCSGLSFAGLRFDPI